MVQFNEEKEERKVAELHEKEEEDLARILADKYSLPYVDLSTTAIAGDALRLVPEVKAREAKLVPYALVGRKIFIGALSPNNEKVSDILKELKESNYTPNLALVSTKSLEKAYGRYKDLSFAFETKAGVLDISNEEIKKVLAEVRKISDVTKKVEEVLAMKKSFRISKIVEIIIAGGLATDASDIHIEPEEGYVRLRFRIDGVLMDVLQFDRETYQLLLSRVKLLSGLKLNLKENAQDGRFTIKIDENEIEIRSSVLPGAYGESIVLRILNPTTIDVPVEKLGIEPYLLAILEKEIERPNGMLLNTGPTGSGKTTTLYAFLKKIHTSKIKIVTIEDPIEYHLPGIVQTQAEEKKGYSFSEGLRSALRQDPDVIMVGEIRDRETAEIAIHAALTGHLVFSTLHTNTAAGAFPRLIDLGINPSVITSAVNVVIAQRLVRKLCEACKKKVPVDGEIKETIEKIVSGVVNKKLFEDISTKFMWKEVGCEKCGGIGFKGRVGIFEAIRTNQDIENIIRQSGSEREVAQAAKPQGILTLAEDGILKVLKGITTIQELRRVIDIDSA